MLKVHLISSWITVAFDAMGCGQKGVAADQRAAAPARRRIGIASDQKSSGCRKVAGIEAVDDARLDGLGRG